MISRFTLEARVRLVWDPATKSLSLYDAAGIEVAAAVCEKRSDGAQALAKLIPHIASMMR